MIDQLDDMDTSALQTAELPHPDFDDMTADTDELASLMDQVQAGINMLKTQRAYVETDPDSLQSALDDLAERSNGLFAYRETSIVRGEMGAIRNELHVLVSQIDSLTVGLI